MIVINQIKIKEKGRHSNRFSTWILDLISTDDGLFHVRLYSISKTSETYGCNYGKIVVSRHKLNANGERMVPGWIHTFSTQNEAESNWKAVLADFREKSCIIVNVRKYREF